MAHAQGADGIKNAVRAGIRSIDHGIYLDDEAIELMKARGTWFVPTLVAPAGRPRCGRRPASSCRRRSSTRRGWSLDIHRAAFRHAVEAGVRIAMGTDSGVTPHGRNLRELELMVAGGMTPWAAYVATTRTAAELHGRSTGSSGTVEVGKLADLVVVTGDPADVRRPPVADRGRLSRRRAGAAGLNRMRPGRLPGALDRDTRIGYSPTMSV